MKREYDQSISDSKAGDLPKPCPAKDQDESNPAKKPRLETKDEEWEYPLTTPEEKQIYVSLTAITDPYTSDLLDKAQLLNRWANFLEMCGIELEVDVKEVESTNETNVTGDKARHTITQNIQSIMETYQDSLGKPTLLYFYQEHKDKHQEEQQERQAENAPQSNENIITTYSVFGLDLDCNLGIYIYRNTEAEPFGSLLGVEMSEFGEINHDEQNVTVRVLLKLWYHMFSKAIKSPK